MQTSMVARQRQRQMRGFVVAWLGVTLFMGAVTFAGIYYATGLINNGGSDSGGDISVAALPGADRDAAAQQATGVPTPTSFPGTGAEPQAEAPVTEAATDLSGPVPDVFQMGVQVQENPDASVYQIWMGEVTDKLKLPWIKQQVRWEDVEPVQGQYDWAALDTTMELTSQAQVRVMLSVVTAPEWAREQGNQRLDEVGPPDDPQTYAAFLTTLLERYPGKVHAIEVWNEMNIDREWASVYGLQPSRYVTLLQTARDAIKAVNPNIVVISGALSPTGVNDGIGAYDDFVYMEMLINAGMLDYADCVGAHHNGYNIGPTIPWNNVPNDPNAIFRGPFDNPHHSWSFYSTLQGYSQRIQNAGSDKKLCITEFGWPVVEDLSAMPQGFEFAQDNTLAEQAQYFDEAIQEMEDWGTVWLAFIWNLNYGAQAGWDATNDNVPYSLLRPDWVPAPAYDVIGAYDFRSQVMQ